MLQVICLTIVAFATIAAIVSFLRGIIWIVGQLRRAKPAPGRARPVGKRLGMTLRVAFGHTTFKHRPFVRAMHWFVMMSFILLIGTLGSAYSQIVAPTRIINGITNNAALNTFIEIVSWVGLVAIIFLIGVRATHPADRPKPLGSDGKVQPRAGRPLGSLPQRFFGSTRWQALFVEFVIAIVLICILLLHAFTYAREVTAAVPGVSAATFPLTAWIGSFFVGWKGLSNAIVLTATVKIVVSMLWLIVVGIMVAMGIAWHRFLAWVNIYAGRNPDGSKALGALEPINLPSGPLLNEEQLEDVEPEDLAPSSARDLTWKRVTDLLSCTECGRCQELCPAWMSGKPLSPKLLVAELRDHYVAQANFVRALGEDATVDDALDAAGRRWARDLMPHSADTLAALQQAQMTGVEGVPVEPVALVGEVVRPETLWACTTCGACVEQCPVNIELLDQVIDLRREQALLQGAFPNDLRKPMKNMERRGNPFGQTAKKRLDWARNLDFDVPVVGEDIADLDEVDYLFWVGCAGAFDDNGKQTSQAVATLLHHAGVKFAVLGSGESCTGDPARRAGNELLFMALAASNIETLNEAKAKRIVVSCAHCFNTLKREYPQFGGNYEVVHYTELVNQLVRDGRLELRSDIESQQPVVYHDACYLGRHNGVYDAPRELIDQVAPRLEMPRAFDRALCCGAGGARAFIEEDPQQRVANIRMAEASATGAATVATACPFCTTMLTSASTTTTENPAATDASAQQTENGANPEATAADIVNPKPRQPQIIDIASLLVTRLK